MLDILTDEALMDFSIAFVLYFTHGMYLISPIVGMLLVIIIGLGLVVGRVVSHGAVLMRFTGHLLPR